MLLAALRGSLWPLVWIRPSHLDGSTSSYCMAVVPGVVADVVGAAGLVDAQEVDGAPLVAQAHADVVAVDGARPVGHAVGVDLAAEHADGGRVAVVRGGPDGAAAGGGDRGAGGEQQQRRKERRRAAHDEKNRRRDEGSRKDRNFRVVADDNERRSSARGAFLGGQVSLSQMQKVSGLIVGLGVLSGRSLNKSGYATEKSVAVPQSRRACDSGDGVEHPTLPSNA
ncbi:hypothetical protein VTK73DRAFT_1880 [Phialemonium thermophilum]|uniref:Uncharacterized protein n=1 Tax=Phialemonium thermophilum TaxID=223376 RepID=A0ABR3VSV3_9PEZI